MFTSLDLDTIARVVIRPGYLSADIAKLRQKLRTNLAEKNNKPIVFTLQMLVQVLQQATGKENCSLVEYSEVVCDLYCSFCLFRLGEVI